MYPSYIYLDLTLPIRHSRAGGNPDKPHFNVSLFIALKQNNFDWRLDKPKFTL